jgi:hypothetical protein
MALMMEAVHTYFNEITRCYIPEGCHLHKSGFFLTYHCRKQVSAARLEAEKDGVVVPLTLEDYCIKTKVKPPEHSVDMTDFYDDDYDLDDEDEEEEENESGDGDYEDGDDSGNGES